MSIHGLGSSQPLQGPQEGAAQPPTSSSIENLFDQAAMLVNEGSNASAIEVLKQLINEIGGSQLGDPRPQLQQAINDLEGQSPKKVVEQDISNAYRTYHSSGYVIAGAANYYQQQVNSIIFELSSGNENQTSSINNIIVSLMRSETLPLSIVNAAMNTLSQALNQTGASQINTLKQANSILGQLPNQGPW